MITGNPAKIYAIENKIVILFSVDEGQEKKGVKKMGVNCVKLLKTHVEKMPVFRLSTMLMKTHELHHSFHDVDEKKWSY